MKNEIIEIGKWIWEKDLTGGMSGNISVKLSDKEALITKHNACLGVLKNGDIGRVDLEGKPLEKDFIPSTEKLFHTSVYKNTDAKAVVHVHPVFSNGFFIANDAIEPDIFEARLTLGSVPVVDQKTPAITDITPVIKALKKSNIVVLKHHGVVAIGETLRDAFFLIQTLEEAVKSICVKQLFLGSKKEDIENIIEDKYAERKYKLFSEEQIKEIVRLVNTDEKFKKLSLDTALETKLAVVLDETNTAYNFHFSSGGIKEYSMSASDAEFVISGKSEYWRAIFNRQLDPFAATTQKKLKLKGDFAKISRWYVPFNRLFELWKETPVE